MRAQWKTCTPSPASPSVAAFHLDFFFELQKETFPSSTHPLYSFQFNYSLWFLPLYFFSEACWNSPPFCSPQFLFPFFAVDICVVWTGLLLSKGACTKRHMQFQYTVYVCKCLHFSSISHLSVLKLASGFFFSSIFVMTNIYPTDQLWSLISMASRQPLIPIVTHIM